MSNDTTTTPWQRVFSRIGLNQSEFAKLIGRHRSKVSRALKDPEGLISGADQKRIIAAAKRAGKHIDPKDMFPLR